MVQVLEKVKKPEKGIELEEFLILEELPIEEEEQIEEQEVTLREKPAKRALLKLSKKAKYNAKYLEKTIPIEKVKNNIHYRRYIVY